MIRIVSLCIVSSTVFLAFSTVFAQARDMVREVAVVEQAPAGNPYYYIVHVPNIPAIGYNPVVKEDRVHSAQRALKSRCQNTQVVGDEKIITEIWGITSSYPDYVVLIRCKTS